MNSLRKLTSKSTVDGFVFVMLEGIVFGVDPKIQTVSACKVAAGRVVDGFRPSYNCPSLDLPLCWRIGLRLSGRRSACCLEIKKQHCTI